MFIVFKFAYQNWKTMTANDVAEQVVKGSITADQYKEITGTDYVAPIAE
ncbi:XkdX family protein [Lactiplantibacillus pentosus]